MTRPIAAGLLVISRPAPSIAAAAQIKSSKIFFPILSPS
jgi:hypothetical protein